MDDKLYTFDFSTIAFYFIFIFVVAFGIGYLFALIELRDIVYSECGVDVNLFH